MCAERAHDADVPGRTEARVCAAVASFYDCCSR
jgi:hypothetical protein